VIVCHLRTRSNQFFYRPAQRGDVNSRIGDLMFYLPETSEHSLGSPSEGWASHIRIE
jgi:hypothetical protein